MKTLKLDSTYRPIGVIDCVEALVMCIVGKATAVEEYEEQISSPSVTFNLPSVIVLKTVVKFINRSVTASRKNIFWRDNYICQYCKAKDKLMTIDHIIPKHKGGVDSWENLVAACIPCNTTKGNKLLKDINMQLIKKPKIPSVLFNIQNELSISQSSWKPYLFMKEKN